MSLSLTDHLAESGLDKWTHELGIRAPVPRQNVKTSLAFFHEQMPTLPPAMALAFLRAMDLSKPVKRVLLQAKDRIIGFRGGNESPFKLFFTRRGQSVQQSGVNTDGRKVVHFVVRTPIWVLESHTTAAIDTWTARQPGQTSTIAPRLNTTGVMAMGGGLQLIIPESYRHMLVEGER